MASIQQILQVLRQYKNIYQWNLYLLDVLTILRLDQNYLFKIDLGVVNSGFEVWMLKTSIPIKSKIDTFFSTH